MTMTADTYARTGESKGLLQRLFAPVVAMRQAWAETQQALATHLLTLDDGALHTLGYRRSELERGVVRSVRAD